MEPVGALGGWVGCSGVNSAYGEAPRPPMGIGGAWAWVVLPHRWGAKRPPHGPEVGAGLGSEGPPS